MRETTQDTQIEPLATHVHTHICTRGRGALAGTPITALAVVVVVAVVFGSNLVVVIFLVLENVTKKRFLAW